jgi:pimeloyl-[acyl-carrier protein] methyl ester esterase
MSAEILAYHGWGYDSNFWTPLQTLLPGGITFRPADRGYFGRVLNPEFSTSDGLNIIFAHSLGLHLIPERVLNQADTLVLMATFDTFIPPDQQAKLLTRLLQRMQQKLLENPLLVIRDFRERAELPRSSEYNIQNINTDLLMEDLIRLEKNHIDFPKLPQKEIVLIEGKDDLIFSSTHMKTYESEYIRYFSIPAAGHAFPFTHPEECFSIIKQAIPILGHHE